MMTVQNSPRARYKPNTKYISHHCYCIRQCKLCVIIISVTYAFIRRRQVLLKYPVTTYLLSKVQVIAKKGQQHRHSNIFYCINTACTKQWVELQVTSLS